MKTTLKSFYKIRFIIILAILHLLFVSAKTNAQNALILNGAYIVENGGTATNNIHLVINQPNPLGIVKLSGGGHIHSENQYNFITWLTASNTGDFVFPFGVGGNNTDSIPFTFSKTAGNNTVSISTWTTDQQNNPKPELTNVAAVSYMNGITDSVLYAIDRFWDIQAPATTADLTFSYRGSENTTTNPTDLIQAQHWNGNSWDSPVETGTNGVTSGIGTAGAVTGQNTFSPWVLIIPTCADTVTINTAICQGDSFIVGSSTYTVSGTYIDTLINVYGCDSIITTNLTINPIPIVGITNNTGSTTIDCNIAQINVTATGGGTYDWGGGITTANYSFTFAGTYTVTVTGSNGCTATESITISEGITAPIAGITNNTGSTTIDCNIVQINVTATGGGTYDWGGGVTTANHSFTSAGIYTVTVTSSNGCTATESITISEDITVPIAGITNNTGSTTIDCNISQINVTAIGGSTYDWGGGITTANNSFTFAGTYTVTVTGNNGCTATESIEISEDITTPIAGITNNTGSTTIDCNIAQINVTATGGGTYDWGGGITTANYSFTSAGTYTVTVTGSNGCTATESITISEGITAPIAGITNNTGSTTIDCNIAQINVTATGGGTYDWGGGVTTADHSFTSAGTYTVTVTGNNGCTATESITISEEIVTANITALTNQDCATPGSATIEGLGGSSPYTYSWPLSAEGVSNNSANSLTAGTYNVTVEDDNGCSIVQPVIIVDVGELDATAIVVSSPTCFGGNEGEIEININIGTADFLIDWGNGSVTNSSGTYSIIGLNAGYYEVTITDINMCSTIVNTNITEPNELILSEILTSHVDIDCYGNSTGALEVTSTGGSPEYQYSLNGAIMQSSGLFNGLTAGTYTIEVEDANSCEIETTIIMSQPAPLVADYMSTNPNCIGINNGYIEFEVIGGTEPYIYIWDMDTTILPYFDDLYEGFYDIVIQDANGCEYNLETISLIDVQKQCIQIPNAFTPNGDGINDTWIIENLDLFNNYHVEVFNRWGQILYDAEAGSMPWDGKTTYGKPVPTGSYIYVVNLYNSSKPVTGILSVIY